MLKLESIKKEYKVADTVTHALKGIDIEFRKNEFVSILGQSGCGKTTLLNIIGGLDRYTSGDLVIGGKSTKDFKSKNWDSYRNYSVGFIFQTYNLITHQTILANVELALTISGISKSERKKRAIKALEEVGLKEHIHKRPNQLSGGQMQRVAIARALVNDPEIILADEPTGALDTKTSVQIMDLLKEIAKKKLIIMVTHNPELAEEYSTRIVKILDGEIIGDTNPYDSKKVNENQTLQLGRTSMKFFTAFRLSLNNLMTKKARTILTSFAGSIGIIGISLILAISTGVQDYIDQVERDTLSSYPITIEQSTIDMSSMMEVASAKHKEDADFNKEENMLYSNNTMNDIMSTVSSQMSTNNLGTLKDYLDTTETVKNLSTAIEYDYNMKLNLYKYDDDQITQVNPSTVMNALGMGELMSAQENSMSPVASMMTSNTDIWVKMLDNKELLESQYNLLDGTWPTSYNEVILIAGNNGMIDDYTLYTLGLKDQSILESQYNSVQDGEIIELDDITSYSYEEILNLSYKLVLNTDYYEKEGNMWLNKSDNNDYLKSMLEDSETIKVVGIVEQKEESSGSFGVSSGIGYLKELEEYVIEHVNQSEIVLEQIENPEINVLSGLEFPSEEEIGEEALVDLTDEQRMAMAQLSAEEISAMMSMYTSNSSATYDDTLSTLGVVNLDEPSTIKIYPLDFDSKDLIAEEIEKYNQLQEENGNDENVITYTDMIAIMMSSVSLIINAISFVLIAFVGISLVVSSIMIGIITYISVLERTKEIGILRAIGASRKDISRVFNAETVIIGLISGLLGIGITIGLTYPINIIIYKLTDVTITTVLPPAAGLILVLISMALTVFAGLIPSGIASKKDPVEALRTD